MADLSTPILAVVTTVHLCFATLRNHRQPSRGVSPLALISFGFAALPWIFATPIGLVGGIAAHIAWFVACEALARPVARPASAPVRSPAAVAALSRTATTARPKGFVATPIIATFDETADIKTIRMLRPQGFDFEAGQFLTVRLQIDGREYARCYSISSAPEARGYLEISIKRQGVVSHALHATARPGSTLSVRAPGGAFRYPSGDDRPIVLIGAGVGITPLLSMLRHACAAEPTRPVTLVYGVRTENDLAFRDELQAIAGRHPHVRMYFAISQGASRPQFYAGRIDEALILAATPDAPHSVSFICGPSGMIDSTREILTALHVPSSQIRFERFEAAIAASAGLDARTRAAEPSGGGRAHAVQCTRSQAQIAAQPGQTLLEAAEAGGIEIPTLCRAGVCGTCRLQVTEGDVRCDSTTLDEEDAAAGFVLACVSTVHSDCTVHV